MAGNSNHLTSEAPLLGSPSPHTTSARSRRLLASLLGNTSPGRACGGSRGCATVRAHGVVPAMARAPRRAAGQAGTPVGPAGGAVVGLSKCMATSTCRKAGAAR